MEISEDLRCVFSAEVEERDGSYVVEVPKREVQLNSVLANEVYRVALVARHADAPDSDATGGHEQPTDDGDRQSDEAPTTASEPSAHQSGSTAGSAAGNGSDGGRSPRNTGTASSGGSGASGEPEPPVDRGDEVTVDIEGIGDQGDGIARVDRGYVIIVPDTEKGERVRIRVTSVKQNVAFAEVVERVERHHYE
mgnify:CR=1 FL=1